MATKLWLMIYTALSVLMFYFTYEKYGWAEVIVTFSQMICAIYIFYNLFMDGISITELLKMSKEKKANENK